MIASHNPGKVREIGALLAPFGVEAISAGALGLPEPEETGDSFEANAELKALASAKASGLPALADDSGLEVDALNGKPGIHSARFAALDSRNPGNSPDADNNGKLLRLLQNVTAEKRTARFRCELVLAHHGHSRGKLLPPVRQFDDLGRSPIPPRSA